MKKIIQMSLIVSAFMMIGCGGGSTTSITSDTDTSTTENNTTTSTSDDTDSSEDNTTTSELTQELKDSITFMYSEEGLAYDVYMNIYKIQAIQPLLNIATNSETKHIELVNQLAIDYDLNITKYPDTDHPYSTDDLDRYGDGEYPVEPIQELYNLLHDKGIQSPQQALEVGCMVEVVDIDDLNEYIEQAEAAGAGDVLTTFTQLRAGSYKHYWQFHEALKQFDEEGCCSVKDELYNPHTGSNFNWCHLEYPQ